MFCTQWLKKATIGIGPFTLSIKARSCYLMGVQEPAQLALPLTSGVCGKLSSRNCCKANSRLCLYNNLEYR